MDRRTGDRERREGDPFDWRRHKVWGDGEGLCQSRGWGGGEQVKEKGNKRAGRREDRKLGLDE